MMENSSLKALFLFALDNIFSVIGLNKLNKYKICQFRCSHGYKFYAFLSDSWRFIKHFEPKTTSTIESLVDKESVVVDVGAHIGLHTIHIAKKAKLTIAIEPEYYNYQLLKRNLLVNGLRNVIALPVACSDFDGIGKLSIDERGSGWHTLERTNTTKVQKVNVRKIDTIIKNLKLAKVDLIKIDVEGHERKVIFGMKELLRLGYPKYLIIETRKSETKDVFKPLVYDYGYELKKILDDYSTACNYLLVKKNLKN